MGGGGEAEGRLKDSHAGCGVLPGEGFAEVGGMAGVEALWACWVQIVVCCVDAELGGGEDTGCFWVQLGRIDGQEDDEVERVRQRGRVGGGVRKDLGPRLLGRSIADGWDAAGVQRVEDEQGGGVEQAGHLGYCGNAWYGGDAGRLGSGGYGRDSRDAGEEELQTGLEGLASGVADGLRIDGGFDGG